MANRHQKLDRAQDAIIRATKRTLGERISKYAAAFIQRYGDAFNLRDFLQTAKTPLLVSLPPIRQKIYDGATTAFVNAKWTSVNEKDRYRIVLMDALILDAGNFEIPQQFHEQLNARGELLITRRNRIQIESFRRYNMGNAPAAQGALAAGAAGFSDVEAHILDAELLHMGVDERLENPFDTLQPNEQNSLDFSNLTGVVGAGAGAAFNRDVFATLHGVALDIITG